jgi:hypothetical protein
VLLPGIEDELDRLIVCINVTSWSRLLYLFSANLFKSKLAEINYITWAEN